MALIDVAVPCYNYGLYLTDCVRSVLSQGIADLRILIVDNASTDDSLAIAKGLAASDPRVTVLAHPVNRGATASYNAGVEWAAARYFLLLDADDMLAPGALAHAINVMEAHGDVAFAHGAETRLHPDGTIRTVDETMQCQEWRIQPGADFIEGLCRCPVNHVGAPTVVRRTAAQKRAGPYDARLPFTDDLELWLRLAMQGQVAETGRVQAIRRIHAAQMSNSYKTAEAQLRDFTEREAAFTTFFAESGSGLPNAKALLGRARRELGRQAYWSAASHLFRGYPATSRLLFGYCARRAPESLLLPPVSRLFQLHSPLGRVREVMLEAIGRHPT